MVFYDIEKINYNNKCIYCTDNYTENEKYNWSFLKKIYIINLSDRKDRKKKAEVQAHKVGLCKYAEFFIPDRDPGGFLNGCFESHRTLCIKSLNNNNYPILILEDDFYFNDSFTPDKLDKLALHMNKYLPNNYETFFLGGYFIYLYPLSNTIFKVRGVTTHSYIANKPFMEFMANTTYDNCKIFGMKTGIDIFYFFKLKNKQYALYPPICYQQNIKSDHYDDKIYNYNNLFLNIQSMKITPHVILLIEILIIMLIYINLISKNVKKYNRYFLYIIGIVIIIFLLWIFIFQKNISNRLFKSI